MNIFLDFGMDKDAFLKANPEVFEKLDEVIALLRRAQCRHEMLNGGMTLTQFYEECYKLEVSLANGVSPLTIRERETSLRYWKEATEDPPLDAIGKGMLCQFVTFLRVTKKLAPATIKKHCAAVRSVLSYAGPKSDKHPDAKELIPFLPRFPCVKVFYNVTSRTPSSEEVEALVQATEVATTPKLPGVSAPKWWECAYKVLALTGMRKSDLLGLRWSHVKKVEGLDVFVIPAEVEKTGVEKIIPISSAARAVLDEMPRGAEDALIFEWPHCQTTFYSQRRRIIEKAGIGCRKRGTFHAIRRWVGTTVRDAQLVLGHTSEGVTVRHYQSMTRAAVALEELGVKCRYTPCGHE